MELIGSGLLVAQREGRAWAVDKESVLQRASSEKIKGRPKGGEPRRHLIHEYTLMCKNEEVVDLSFAASRQEVASVEKPKNPQLLPVGASAVPGKTSVCCMGAWISERYIPKNRIGLDALLKAAGVSDPATLMFESFGLNLTDQYWFRPKGAQLDWEKINYFDNYLAGVAKDSGKGPDSGTPGMLKKWWEWREENYYQLVKESQIGGREPYAEAAATRLYERLLFASDYVPYTIEEGEKGPLSVCPCFTNRDTQLVTMRDLLRCFKRDAERISVEEYVTLLEELGVPDAAKQVSKMLVCDYLSANDDRHTHNLGVIRSTGTGEYLGVAPIFDNGRGFFTAVRREEELTEGLYVYTANPFSSYANLQLASVPDTSWLDLGALEGFAEETGALLGSNPEAPAWFGEAAVKQLKRRVAYARDTFYERKPGALRSAGRPPKEKVVQAATPAKDEVAVKNSAAARSVLGPAREVSRQR